MAENDGFALNAPNGIAFGIQRRQNVERNWLVCDRRRRRLRLIAQARVHQVDRWESRNDLLVQGGHPGERPVRP